LPSPFNPTDALRPRKGSIRRPIGSGLSRTECASPCCSGRLRALLAPFHRSHVS